MVRPLTLVFDTPLTGWIAPSKPTLVAKPPSGEQWLHEIKWDGYRISITVEDGRVTVFTSSGLD